MVFLVLLRIVVASSDTDSMGALRRANSTDLVLELNASYSPQGRSGSAIDMSGEIYNYTALIEETSLGVTGIAGLSMSSRVGFLLTSSSWKLSEERLYATGPQVTSSSGSHLSSCVFFEQRLLPNHPLDPRIRVSFTNPGLSGISISASYILDPVVLAGKVDFLGSARSPTNWISVTWSVGFAANARLSLVAIGYLGVPINGLDVPSTSIGLRARIAQDHQRQREMDVEFAWVMIGETPHVMIELCLRRRHSESNE